MEGVNLQSERANCAQYSAYIERVHGAMGAKRLLELLWNNENNEVGCGGGEKE